MSRGRNSLEKYFFPNGVNTDGRTPGLFRYEFL